MFPKAAIPQRRAAAAAGASKASVLAALKKQVNAKFWEMFDTVYFGSTAFPGQASANTFATVTSPIAFFNNAGRINGVQAGAFCSNGDTGKMEFDFVTRAIAVDVMCPSDAGSNPGIATAQAFAEPIIYTGVLKVEFGGKPQLHMPLTGMPSGGGMVTQAKVRTQGMGAFSDSASINNGIPDPRAIKVLDEPLIVPAGQAFTCNLLIPTDAAGTAGPLHRLQNLFALTADINPLIRVRFIGLRGEPMLLGISTNPELKWIWSSPAMTSGLGAR